VLRRVQPDVLVGLGGYISFPGALMGLLRRKPLVLHEQNAVAGLANRLLAGRADRVFAAFPGAFGSAAPKARWVGNPLRAAFTQQAGPAERFAARTGPLRDVRRDDATPRGAMHQRALGPVARRATPDVGEGIRPRVQQAEGPVAVAHFGRFDDDRPFGQVEPGVAVDRVVVRADDLFVVRAEATVRVG
ncbi:UDP-N-acetylglucosamine--N-acetylmuramyl-(pentapeptide) pyrophosphoryl-undecaprenol N-acetylglucosamine transferase, partial [Verminephrobacter sp. Larva24]